jgi:hypothetical protein
VDERITAAAVVGSRAHTEGDQWSDLDLTFAVADPTPPVAVLDEWAEKLRAQFDGTALFDLAAGPVTYRVFLLPGALQVDLSVTPTSQFAARGDTFRLLFGAANEPVIAGPRNNTETYGHAVHHAVRNPRPVRRRGSPFGATPPTRPAGPCYGDLVAVLISEDVPERLMGI